MRVPDISLQNTKHCFTIHVCTESFDLCTETIVNQIHLVPNGVYTPLFNTNEEIKTLLVYQLISDVTNINFVEVDDNL